jgi:hypothetical protein
MGAQERDEEHARTEDGTFSHAWRLSAEDGGLCLARERPHRFVGSLHVRSYLRRDVAEFLSLVLDKLN